MTARATPRAIPPAWPTLRDRKGYEYLDGAWARVPTSIPANLAAFRLIAELDEFSEKGGGLALPSGCGLQIWPQSPNRYRKPDGSYFGPGRLPRDKVPEGMVNLVPDLVIEAISPSDNANDIDVKVQEYFEAGVRMVWVLFPKTRTVLVLHADGRALRLTEQATLTGEGVSPGFAMPVMEIFN
ncbi:MAG: Uma2 family endonuclease [Dehalococcoidia bacterium]